jgi:hypothetical protein
MNLGATGVLCGRFVEKPSLMGVVGDELARSFKNGSQIGDL